MLFMKEKLEVIKFYKMNCNYNRADDFFARHLKYLRSFSAISLTSIGFPR